MLKINKTYRVITRPRLIAAATLALATVLSTGPVSAAETETASSCGQLPNVAWWSKSHQKVKKFVDTRHRGDWDSYVEKWSKYQNRMQEVYARQGTALIKSRDLRLEGETLAAHIKDIGTRLAVIKCLAEEAETAEIQKLANLDTAAGGNFETASREDTPGGPSGGLPAASDRDNQRFALLSSDGSDSPGRQEESAYKVEINAHCLDDGTRVFEVTNIGAEWPKRAAVSIYEVERMKVVSKRVMRLAQNQRMTFRLPKTYGDQKELVAWVQPTWMLRDFRYDAKLLCK